ncbi:MAG: glutamyl-tRNA reductase, partial [Rhodospirillales bacterium]|nr:glutamyl-tRNA reductase [Rhodospirillales bacterium]
MTAASLLSVRPVVVGLNHRSSALSLRDLMFVDDSAQPAVLHALREAGLTQAVVLSTCDRVEVLTLHPEPERAAELVLAVLAGRAGLEPRMLSEQTYLHSGSAAVRHCFAVASSLDSMMIGEPHILGQVKAVHRMAREAGLAGPEIETLLQAAYAAAKRVRSETHIAERPVSIAAAAVEFARDLHGDLDRCSGLLVGGGEMGELVAESLQAAGLKRLVVTAPRLSRAEALAKTLGCHVAEFATLPVLLAESDIVLSCIGSRHTVLTAEAITQALKKRRRKPIFLVDAAIPGDIEPAVNRVEEAFLYDLADLERIALEGRASREAAAGEAWAIVEAEVGAFLKTRAERAAVPALVALRSRFEAERERVLAESGGDADKATRLLVQRLLHPPSEVM